MNASDIMTSPVLSVDPVTPVVQVAALLRERRIGGVPVLLGPQLVGMVTEKDLLHRREIGTAGRAGHRSWWRRIVGAGAEPHEYIKSHGRCARHVMSRHVIVVRPQTSLLEVTGLFDRHRIGRVPVVQHGRLVGIVTSADLVRALAEGAGLDPQQSAPRDDDAILGLLLEELHQQDWWSGGCCNVHVRSGVVRFSGYFENAAQQAASRVAAENVPGVRRVLDDRRPIAELPTMV